MTTACQHRRGEFADDYQRCLDCGREVILIGGAWFEVEGWVRLPLDWTIEERPAPPPEA